VSSQPPEDLIVTALLINSEYKTIVSMTPRALEPGETPDWRYYIGAAARRLWGRLDFETRVALYVNACEVALKLSTVKDKP
jgi:hypothetical protein